MSMIFAQDRILDTSKILKENQTVVINARTNTINYVLEILPNGKIIKKYLNTDEQKALKNELGLQDINIGYTINKQKSTINTKSHIKTWDKRKIIYEQQVETIRIK